MVPGVNLGLREFYPKQVKQSLREKGLGWVAGPLFLAQPEIDLLVVDNKGKLSAIEIKQFSSKRRLTLDKSFLKVWGKH